MAKLSATQYLIRGAPVNNSYLVRELRRSGGLLLILLKFHQQPIADEHSPPDHEAVLFCSCRSPQSYKTGDFRSAKFFGSDSIARSSCKSPGCCSCAESHQVLLAIMFWVVLMLMLTTRPQQP